MQPKVDGVPPTPPGAATNCAACGGGAWFISQVRGAVAFVGTLIDVGVVFHKPSIDVID